jgi:hypothetical protein
MTFLHADASRQSGHSAHCEYVLALVETIKQKNRDASGVNGAFPLGWGFDIASMSQSFAEGRRLLAVPILQWRTERRKKSSPHSPGRKSTTMQDARHTLQLSYPTCASTPHATSLRIQYPASILLQRLHVQLKLFALTGSCPSSVVDSSVALCWPNQNCKSVVKMTSDQPSCPLLLDRNASQSKCVVVIILSAPYLFVKHISKIQKPKIVLTAQSSSSSSSQGSSSTSWMVARASRSRSSILRISSKHPSEKGKNGTRNGWSRISSATVSLMQAAPCSRWAPYLDYKTGFLCRQ